MPKKVDYGQRREEIAAALYRVIVRAGVEGATVRAVAQEAGWSAGALRHYFGTQDELLRYGIESQLDRIPARMAAHLGLPPGRDRAWRLLAELLPLDDDRLAETRVWLAFASRARHEPAMTDLLERAWVHERWIARGVVCDLQGNPWPADQERALGAREEAEAAALGLLVDGLNLAGATYPQHMPSERMAAVLTEHLASLQARLRSAGTAS